MVVDEGVDVVALQELRKAVSDVLCKHKELDDDLSLMRWLRARNMDVKKAERMFRNAVRWRDEHHVEDLVYAEPPLELVKRVPLFTDGFTHDGIIVSSIQAGKLDFPQLVDDLGREKVLRYSLQFYIQSETVLLDLCRKNNHKAFKGAFIIVDYSDYSYMQLRCLKTLQMGIELTKIMVNYFPYLASHVICINCNPFAQVVIKMIKPIVERQHLKIDAFGEDREEWSRAISAHVPPDQIREAFGGTKTGEMVILIPDCLVPPHLRNSNETDVNANITR